MTDDKIKSKIQKCLALSKSSNAAEAATALRHAQKLMEKHRLTEQDVAFLNVNEFEVLSKVSVSRPKLWELKLIRNIAESFGCEISWCPSNSYAKQVYGCYNFIGINDQPELAKYICEVMQRKAIINRAEFSKTIDPRCSKTAKTKLLNDYMLGWVKGTSAMLHKFIFNDGEKLLIENYVKSLKLKDGKVIKQVKANESMFNAGFERGSTEQINRPVNTSYTEPMRLK